MMNDQDVGLLAEGLCEFLLAHRTHSSVRNTSYLVFCRYISKYLSVCIFLHLIPGFTCGSIVLVDATSIDLSKRVGRAHRPNHPAVAQARSN
jgi:hypothetical protein